MWSVSATKVHKHEQKTLTMSMIYNMKHWNTRPFSSLYKDLQSSIWLLIKYISLLQYRVSAVISNSPYTLVLDCDMFCSEPDSARQAMCFHLDPKISTSLAFVQFPQKFHNISKNDIYDSQHRSAYKVKNTKQEFKFWYYCI
jgi:hypothetical protein